VSPSTPAACIFGLAGETLAAEERDLLSAVRPAGIILFARNCRAPEQVRALVAEARAATWGDDLMVAIDQEGGRVQRLRPPQWRALPAAAAYGHLWLARPARAEAMACAVAHLMAADLRALGIDMDCAPVADLPVAGAHDIIGDRAYGSTVEAVVALAAAVARGLMAGGVVPVVKHIPGHGRATADSHLALPVVETPRAVLEASDFATFRALAHLPAAMTAHVVFSDIDPVRPASTSALVTEQVIRASIGFDGLLMSDDLGMHALAGGFAERAEAVLAAGSDLVLHCSGVLDEMREVAGVTPRLSGMALTRAERARAVARQSQSADHTQAEAALAVLLGPRSGVEDPEMV
jgi:beta-N-acetylhexosaminidase